MNNRKQTVEKWRHWFVDHKGDIDSVVITSITALGAKMHVVWWDYVGFDLSPPTQEDWISQTQHFSLAVIEDGLLVIVFEFTDFWRLTGATLIFPEIAFALSGD